MLTPENQIDALRGNMRECYLLAVSHKKAGGANEKELAFINQFEAGQRAAFYRANLQREKEYRESKEWKTA